MSAKQQPMLTQNTELRSLGVYNWSIPALHATLSSGQRFTTCPSAGVCARYCYARANFYIMGHVRRRHTANLERVLADLQRWQDDMVAELAAKRRQDCWVRIHDAGDFYADDYLAAWLEIARRRPTNTFYCYTREVSRFRRLVEQPGACPDNFLYCYSLGGMEDHLLDLNTDRHADVFPSEAAAAAAGYTSVEGDDRLAVTAPTNRLAVIVNEIPHLKRRQGAATFGQLQAAQDAVRVAKRGAA